MSYLTLDYIYIYICIRSVSHNQEHKTVKIMLSQFYYKLLSRSALRYKPSSCKNKSYMVISEFKWI